MACAVIEIKYTENDTLETLNFEFEEEVGTDFSKVELHIRKEDGSKLVKLGITDSLGPPFQFHFAFDPGDLTPGDHKAVLKFYDNSLPNALIDTVPEADEPMLLIVEEDI